MNLLATLGLKSHKKVLLSSLSAQVVPKSRRLDIELPIIMSSLGS